MITNDLIINGYLLINWWIFQPCALNWIDSDVTTRKSVVMEVTNMGMGVEDGGWGWGLGMRVGDGGWTRREGAKDEWENDVKVLGWAVFCCFCFYIHLHKVAWSGVSELGTARNPGPQY